MTLFGRFIATSAVKYEVKTKRQSERLMRVLICGTFYVVWREILTESNGCSRAFVFSCF